MTFRPDNEDLQNMAVIERALNLKTKSAVIKMALKMAANLLK